MRSPQLPPPYTGYRQALAGETAPQRAPNPMPPPPSARVPVVGGEALGRRLVASGEGVYAVTPAAAPIHWVPAGSR